MADEQKTVKMFWEGPGASRNGQGLTLAVTVRPDGNGEITNHQARTQLRVGDVQLVVQASCCDIDPSQFTADQREALDVVLTAMVDRIRDELGIAGECEDEEAGECEPSPFDVDPWARAEGAEDTAESEGDEAEDDTSDGDMDIGKRVSDFTDADLAAMEQEKLMELLESVGDDESEDAERLLPHITNQELLCNYWADNGCVAFDDAMTKRLAECIVADGAVTASQIRENPEDLGAVAAACEGDALAALAKVLTEEQRWIVIRSNDLPSVEQDDCVLGFCNDQKKLSEVLCGGEFGGTGRRIALGRMTDVALLKRVLDDLDESDPLLLEVRDRYLALIEQPKKRR